MKFLILSVVVLAIACCGEGKTVQDCAQQARECKKYLAPLARSGNSREQFLNTIRNTPINDICSTAQGFLQCGRTVLSDPECSQFEAISKYEPLYTKLNKAIQFTCVKEKDAVERAIPCFTTRQFMGKIARCKRTNPCNSEGSWNCAKAAVASLCDADTSTWFDSYVPLFQQNHPGCGQDSLMRRLYAAMHGQN